MPKFEVTVVIECETPEQANLVLDSRLGYYEEMAPEDGGPFTYTIEPLLDMREVS